MTPDKTDKGGYITAAAYEGDIVSRLRSWRGLHLAHGGKLFDEAADEIERLWSQPCPYVTGRVTKYCTLSSPALTDAEREAVDRVAGLCAWRAAAKTNELAGQDAATLRGLLDRLA